MDALNIVAPLMVFAILMVIGVEIAFSLCFAATLGLVLQVGWTPTLGFVESTVLSTAASYTLTTIPMFLLMAGFAERSGIISKIFELCERLTTRISGGLAYAVVGASTMMGALSGDSLGTTGAMAKMAVPEMIRRGYSQTISLGVVASAGTIAIMIPPSLALVIYGILTETSIAALLLAGILPGLLTAVVYAGAIFIAGRVGDHFPPKQEQRTQWGGVLRAVGPTWPFLVIVALVIYVMYGGIATSTEAAALGALATLLLWMCLSVGRGQVRKFTGSGFSEVIVEAARTTAMIMFLVIGATLLGYYLTVTGITRAVGDYLANLQAPTIVILLLILSIYLILGMFLSQLTTLILTLPIILPVILDLGFSPIWFGIVATKMVEIGLLTPPVGLNAYVAASATAQPIGLAFRGTRIFLAAEAVVLTLLVAFPDISLAIPRSAGLI